MCIRVAYCRLYDLETHFFYIKTFLIKKIYHLCPVEYHPRFDHIAYYGSDVRKDNGR